MGFPRGGKLASMLWKIGKTGFHGMELFPKLASLTWKNAEFFVRKVRRSQVWEFHLRRKSIL